MFTVSGLARRCGLSRTTVLYYESRGLLKAPRRTSGNYRAYGERDLLRLQQICAYRKLGIGIADIRAVLDRPEPDAATVLKRRLLELDDQIETLRGHQRGILRLLQKTTSFRRTEMITKERWVGIMKAAGFSQEAMERWHVEFERSAPAEHQEFLEFLHIPPTEIATIREWSRKGHE
jgi:DNA-binding transcriptional MerR regulator